MGLNCFRFNPTIHGWTGLKSSLAGVPLVQRCGLRLGFLAVELVHLSQHRQEKRQPPNPAIRCHRRTFRANCSKIAILSTWIYHDDAFRMARGACQRK